MAADRPQASLRRSNLPTGTASSKLAPAQGTLRRPQRLATPKAGLTIPQEASSLHSQSTVLSPPLDYPHAGGKNQPPLTPFTTEPRDPTTPGRVRRLEASSAGDSNADETFKKPAVPSSATRKAAERSTPSRSRRLSQSTSGKNTQDAEGLDTVKPATRTLSSSPLAASSRRTTPRKKAMVSGGGPALIPPSRDLSSSRGAREPAQPSLNRSSDGLSTSTKTPLRSSVSASRGVSSTLSTSQARRTLAVPETGVRAREATGSAATIRRKAGPLLSAIPVPSTSSQGSRALHRPPSVVSTASSHTEQADASRRGNVPRRSSAQLGVAAQQTSRKSSWETVRSTRDSLASSSRRRSSITLLVGGDADRSWETVESRRASRTAVGVADATMETPRRPSQPISAHIVSPPSPDSAGAASGVPRVSATDGAASPETLSTTSHFSHAAFLSPMPPPPIDVLSNPPPHPRPGPATYANRSKPRESTSLDEILRLGMLNQSQLAGTAAGGSGGGGLELELLLDEGSSRMMTEELRDSLGPTTGDAASPAPTTPWRARIVSVGASARRRSLATSGQALGSRSEDAATLSPPPPRNAQAGPVLLLRQSTTEASDLRRQVAALSAELELVKRERDETVSTVERDRQAMKDERVEALQRELEAAQARENELRSDWEAERRAMEEDMAELAAASAAATASSSTLASSPPLPEEAAAAAVHSQQAREIERARWTLLLTASESAGASLRAGTTFGQVEQLAVREREDTRLALASLQTLARGLEGWRALL
ncbi:hypothetical protein JCM8115_000249 [Rhodotorula mucilaginosa]